LPLVISHPRGCSRALFPSQLHPQHHADLRATDRAGFSKAQLDI